MTVAIITAVSGKAWVKDAEGNLRVAQEGDALLAGEVLITADGASVGLAFMDGRPPVVIGEATQVAMVMELGEGDLTSSLALESADVAAIIDLLESAEGDLLDALEEPAAGEAGAAGPGGEGHSFVRLLRIVEDVDPLAFEFNQARLDDIAVRDGQGAGAQSDSDQPVSLTGLDGSDPGVPGTPENPPVNPSTDPGTPDNSGNPNSPADDDYAAAFSGAEQAVWESGLADGSTPSSSLVTRSGSFGFSTPDGLQALVIGDSGPLDIARLQGLSSNPLTVETPLGTLLLTGFTGDESSGSISYTYILSENVDNDSAPGARDEGALDSISVTVTDADGSTATGSLDIAIIDDVPAAADDATTTDEDTPVTVDVIANDIRGADGAVVTDASLLDSSQGSVVLNEDGTVTFTPAPGFEGDALIEYTLTDGDGDTSQATLTVTVAGDSTPETVIPPGEPGDPGTPPEPADPDNPEYPGDPGDPSDNIDLAAGDSLRVVDEAGLSDGSNADADTEMATGTFAIDTKGDSLQSLVINGTDVTAAGSGGISVSGEY
ncbi:retention module-containing protein, partial [Halomonas cupida]